MENNIPPMPQPPRPGSDSISAPMPQPPMPESSPSITTPPPIVPMPSMSIERSPSNKKVILIVSIILGVLLLLVAVFVVMKFSKSSNSVSNETSKLLQQSDISSDIKSNDEKNITPTNTSATADIDNIKCDNEYDALIEKHGREYGEECMAGIGGMECAKPEKADLPKNVVMIIDASGSMAASMGGKTKMEVAKAAAVEFTKNLSPDIKLSIVTYGHMGNNSTAGKATSCAGIEEIFWLGAPNGNIINNKIGALKANGWTPIGGALQKAKDILSKYPSTEYSNSVLLISDGEETCNGDSVSEAKELNSSNINVVVNVVGFDVGGKAESQLKSTAENGKGAYFSARNASELSAALGNVTESCLRKGRGVALVQANSSVLINCIAVLGGEWASISLPINRDSSDECRSYIRNKYDERYKSLKAQFEALDAQNKKNFKDAYGQSSTGNN